jgi:hypothetical protein
MRRIVRRPVRYEPSNIIYDDYSDDYDEREYHEGQGSHSPREYEGHHIHEVPFDQTQRDELSTYIQDFMNNIISGLSEHQGALFDDTLTDCVTRNVSKGQEVQIKVVIKHTLLKAKKKR